MALHVVVGTAHDGVTLRVRSGRVVPGLIFLPGSACHARVILHAHVRLADDWIALRVGARRVVARGVRRTGRTRRAHVVLHALVHTTPHNVTLRVATGGVITRDILVPRCTLHANVVLYVHAPGDIVRVALRGVVAAIVRRTGRTRHACVVLHAFVCAASHRVARRVRPRGDIPGGVRLPGGHATHWWFTTFWLAWHTISSHCVFAPDASSPARFSLPSMHATHA